jgi:hypothetical protein
VDAFSVAVLVAVLLGFGVWALATTRRVLETVEGVDEDA